MCIYFYKINFIRGRYDPSGGIIVIITIIMSGRSGLVLCGVYVCGVYIYTYIYIYIHTYIYVNVCSDEKTPASKLVQRGDSFMLQRPEYIIANICKCALGTGYSSTKMKHGLSMRFSQFDTAVSLDRAQPRPLCGIERLRHTYANNPMIRNIGQV